MLPSLYYPWIVCRRKIGAVDDGGRGFCALGRGGERERGGRMADGGMR